MQGHKVTFNECPVALEVSLSSVSTGGDVVTKLATVIEAIDAGKRLLYIDCYIRGEHVK